MGSKQAPARAPRGCQSLLGDVWDVNAWSGNQNAVRCYAKMALGSLQSGIKKPLQLQASSPAVRPSASDPSDYLSLTFVNAPRGPPGGQPFDVAAAVHCGE